MTVDDESSVYVGGLSYDSTEDMLQKAFEEYGDIVSIKSRGFGFVTFTSPRAASKAISGMDGNLLGGRTIRVNEAKKQGGKMLGRENSFRDRGEKERDHRDVRDRERSGRGRNFSPHRIRRSSPAPGRSGRGRSPFHRRSRSPRAARSLSPNSSSGGRVRARSSPSLPSPRSSDLDRLREETSRRPPKLGSRVGKDKHTDLLKVREELEQAIQSRQDLEEKIARLSSAVENAEESIFVLQAKSQKLEESLTNATNSASHRQSQLRKLQKGVLQVKDSSDRLKHSEKDLKALMIATMSDLESGGGENEDRSLVNGGHHEGEKRGREEAGAP